MYCTCNISILAGCILIFLYCYKKSTYTSQKKVSHNYLHDMLKYAIYFPQFHQIRENDINFYHGYTDIINLRDLDVPSKETPSHKELLIKSINDYDYVVNQNLIQTQIELLKKYNIDGFATYHYWFSDNNITGNKMIMENINTKLLNSELGNKKIFYIWANENWTNNYHLGDSKKIIRNTYSDIEEHCTYLVGIFQHKNYLKIDKKPVFLIHHPWLMQKYITKYEDILNKMCQNVGYNGVFLSVSSFKTNKSTILNNKSKYYDHHPHYKSNDLWSYNKTNEPYSFLNYKIYVDNIKNISDIQTIFFDFDNRARLYKSKNNRKATICTHNTEEEYIKYFNKIKENVPKILLINSWNEWGEKMHIEPSNEKGNYYLELINKHLGYPNIPIVIISWNCLTFIRNFVKQIKHLPNDIIIIDNNSQYPELHTYYDILEKELKGKITIKRLNENYGHEVYRKRRDLLPDVYILSDPDLQLNENMPINISNILYDISNKYKKFKVGVSLDISDSDKFENINNYMDGKNIKDWEKQFWTNPIKNDKYELYDAPIDTTFTLVNWQYLKNSGYKHLDGIRIAGDFTTKHLPWYKNFYKENIPEIELKYLNKNNISGTTLAAKKGIKDNKFFR